LLWSSQLPPCRITSGWLLSPEYSDFPENEADLHLNKEKSGKNSVPAPFSSEFLVYVISASGMRRK